MLVTFNVKDFPLESVATFDIEIVHPDDFLLDQLDLYPGPTVGTFRQLVETYDAPEMTSEDLLLSLSRTVPGFSAALRDHLD